MEVKGKDVGEQGYLTNLKDNLSQWDMKESTVNGVKKMFVRIFVVEQPKKLHSDEFLASIGLKYV